MTYGYWITRTRAHLGDTLHAMADSGPRGAADILSLTGSRAKVYQQLPRHVDMLVQPPKPHSSVSMPDLVRALVAFRQCLRSAADDAIAPGPNTATSSPVRSLIAAADCLGVAGDILAGHLHAGRHTPEGAAIRAGGGVVPAAVELARVASDVLAIDLAVSGWLDRADRGVRAVAQPLVDATRRTTTSTMPSVLGEIRAITPNGPALLTDLTAVPAVDAPAEAIHTVADAAAGLRAARTWLWHNPDLLRVVHLRLGTQLGLATTLLADRDGHPGRPAAHAWRQAATLAAALKGSRPSEDAIPAAHRLGDVLIWTRSTLQSGTPGNVSAITDQLRSLAQSLINGTTVAVRQGDVFIHQMELRRVKAGIIRPTSTWRHATFAHHEINDLCDALDTLSHEQGSAGANSAGRAFPHPQQTTTSAPWPPTPATISPAAPRRGPSR